MKLRKLMEVIGKKEPITLWDTDTGTVYRVDASNEIVSEFLQYEVLYVSFDSAGLNYESTVITIRRSETRLEAEDKENFIQGLGNLLHKYAGRTNVAKIEYIQEQNNEFALITFANGSQKRKCITGDSCTAIMNDIYKVLL